LFVSVGASKALMKDERQKFLEEEWPKVYATIQRLGLSPADLLQGGAAAPSTPWPTTPGNAKNDSSN
jgi:GntR family transcriptional regulator